MRTASFCFILLSTLPAIAIAADAGAPVGSPCAGQLDDARPDLASVIVEIGGLTYASLKTLGIPGKWLQRAIVDGRRDGMAVSSDREPRFLMFVWPEDAGAEPLRVEYFWKRALNRILVSHLSAFNPTRDRAIYESYQRSVPLRHQARPLLASDSAIQRAAESGVSLTEISEALTHPIGPAIGGGRDLSVIGRTAEGSMLFVKYRLREGVPYVRTARPGSVDDERDYLARGGRRTEVDEDRSLRPNRGVFRDSSVAYGFGARARMHVAGGVTARDLIEALERAPANSVRDEESALVRAPGADVRKWFVAQLPSGRRARVTIADTADGVVIIAAAYVDRAAFDAFRALLR